MRHFLFEFITGGGLADQPLPSSLKKEGEIMLQALLQDLSELDSTDIVVCRDHRLPVIEDYNVTLNVIKESDVKRLPENIQSYDVVWVIAPETDNCLYDWAKRVVIMPIFWPGSSLQAIQITSSKYDTYQNLDARGVPTIETAYLSEKEFPQQQDGWIVKPDDGAGANGVMVVEDPGKLQELAEDTHYENYIVQPNLAGEAMSLSLLCVDGKVMLLGCNKQVLEQKEGQLFLKEVIVNACTDESGKLFQLAEKIVDALPGLFGYVGVDIIRHDGNYYVVEINPRLTTAYTGLSRSINLNVAGLIIKAMRREELPEIDLGNSRSVTVQV